MKRVFSIILSIITGLLFVSCEQPTMLSVSQTALSFDNGGGNQSVTITANKVWTASSNQGWLRVSPSSGEGTATLSVSCEANTTYDSRTGTITIKSEELTQTISVTQAEGQGLLVSQVEYNLSNEAQTISVEVKANVQYMVDIDAACRDWIKQESTKGLSSNTIKFAISKNENYDGREGKITIRQANGNLSATVIVKQSQTNGLFAEKTEYEVSYEEQQLNIKVKSNVDYDVQIDDACKDWISRVQTKGLVESTVSLAIAKNEEVEREGKVILKYGGIEETIRIKQGEGFVEFEDENFKAYCLKEYDINKDGKISCTEAMRITYIEVSHVSSLKGIELMPNLDTLRCYNGELKSIDVSKNVKLTRFDCQSNQLTNMDVSQNTALTYLNCDSNQLTSLDVSNCPQMLLLHCDKNQLASLDVSKNAELKELWCDNNQLTSLDVSNCPQMRLLSCGKNQLASLDVSNKTKLSSLFCGGNYLKTLDVSNCLELSNLDCNDNQITSLDLSKNTKLSSLYCGGNYLKTLDVSNCAIFSLNVSNSTFLTELILDSDATKRRGGLIVSNCTSLTALDCNGLQFTQINASNCTSLTELSCDCFEQQPSILYTFLVDNCTALKKLNCNRRYGYRELDISSCLGLEILNCNHGGLSSLNVSKNTALKELWCDNNQLKSLDVSNNTALTSLFCHNNQLTSLDVSQNTALTTLWCFNNYRLREIWLKNGQTITDFQYDTDVATIKYK